MAINWQTVGQNVATAIGGVVGAAWNATEPSVQAQLAALVQIGQTIEAQATATPPTITPDAYQYLKYTEQSALETVLKNAEAIGVVVATQAAAAAWGVVETAVVALLPFKI